MLDAIQPKKPNRKIDTFGQFLTYDRQILRFNGYWDDRNSENGTLHNLEIYYYLADDTVEVKEVLTECGVDKSVMFIRRDKLPKVSTKQFLSIQQLKYFF